MEGKDATWFFRAAGMLLVLTATAKLYSAGGAARILGTQDQLFHIGFRSLLFLAAFVEIGVATFLLRSRRDLKRSLVLLWLSVNFICYHVANYLLGIHYCPCLGTLEDRSPLPRGLASIILQVLALYWVIGGLSSLWRLWGSERWARLAVAPRGLFRKPPATAHPYRRADTDTTPRGH